MIIIIEAIIVIWILIVAEGRWIVETKILFLKKNLNASRPSEHPPVRGKNVKTVCCLSYLSPNIQLYIYMGITTEAGALFDNHPRLKNKAFLLDITIVNPCAGSNLGNTARHVGKHLADAVERKKNKYRGSFPATYSLLSLAMSTCSEVGSDVHALIKELAIRRVQHRSETHPNESQHLAEGTEVARRRRRFSFVLQQALSFRTRHHLCRQGVALASTRQPHSQGSASIQAHRTGGVTGSERQEGANGVGGGIGVGDGKGDGDGDVNGHGDGGGGE